MIRPQPWSANKTTEKAVDYLFNPAGVIRLFDQEALNVALAGRWSELDPEWNVSRFWTRPERRVLRPDILSHAKIVHFLSEDKPWLPERDSLHPWLRRQYDAHAVIQ